MSSIHLSIPHPLSREEALRRLRSGIVQVRETVQGLQGEIQDNWSGTEGDVSFKIMTLSGNARVHVNDHDIDIEIDIPFMNVFMKKMVEKQIKNNLKGFLK